MTFEAQSFIKPNDQNIQRSSSRASATCFQFSKNTYFFDVSRFYIIESRDG